MAKVLGYGGLGNTNGARSFAGREESAGGGRSRRMRAMAHGAGAPWYVSIIAGMIWLVG